MNDSLSHLVRLTQDTVAVLDWHVPMKKANVGANIGKSKVSGLGWNDSGLSQGTIGDLGQVLHTTRVKKDHSKLFWLFIG